MPSGTRSQTVILAGWYLLLASKKTCLRTNVGPWPSGKGTTISTGSWAFSQKDIFWFGKVHEIDIDWPHPHDLQQGPTPFCHLRAHRRCTAPRVTPQRSSWSHCRWDVVMATQFRKSRVGNQNADDFHKLFFCLMIFIMFFCFPNFIKTYIYIIIIYILVSKVWNLYWNWKI